MTGLLDKNGKKIAEADEPKAKCMLCEIVLPVSRFLGDEPEKDYCPICGNKHWEFV